MKKLLSLLLLIACSSAALADIPAISLETAPIDPNDMKSIERGAKFFASTCMSCHTLIYLRYDELAEKAGVLYDKMPINTKWPASAIPPDLSLEADVRGVNWIYTYLHSFYQDPSRPTGVNNLLVPNTMMPGIVAVLQGQQVLSTDLKQSVTLSHEWQWYDVLTLQAKGSMDEAQFDANITDVVNFLNYAAEPFHPEQTRLGWKVLLFLTFFFAFAYALKREYWKDIKKKNDE